MARKMPQNIEAEMSVLGVAFIDPDCVSKIVEEVNLDMFLDEKNKDYGGVLERYWIQI